MNKLKLIEKMGFKITWKLIYIGLYGTPKIPVQLNCAELFDYLIDRLNDNDEWVDEIVLLICEKEDKTKIQSLISQFAKNEKSDNILQERKWRAFKLKNILNNMCDDCLQGLLQLMEFWVLDASCKDIPFDIPNSRDEDSIKNYFTKSMYKKQIVKNKNWLNKEINLIISEEKHQDSERFDN